LWVATITALVSAIDYYRRFSRPAPPAARAEADNPPAKRPISA
jgi:hypothetical protein